MDFFDGIRLGQDQKVVIALLVTGAADETITAKMIFIKPQSLNLRAHCAIENEDTFAGGLAQRAQNFRAVALCPFRAEQIVKHGRTPHFDLQDRKPSSHIKICLCQYIFKV